MFMPSAVVLKQRLWFAPCAALTAMALMTGATPTEAHERGSSTSSRTSRQHQHSLFQHRKDWELQNLHRRRGILRAATWCMQRAQSTRALERCERTFDQALSSLSHDRERALTILPTQPWPHGATRRWTHPAGHYTWKQR